MTQLTDLAIRPGPAFEQGMPGDISGHILTCQDQDPAAKSPASHPAAAKRCPENQCR
jgi:hypothetical protein